MRIALVRAHATKFDSTRLQLSIMLTAKERFLGCLLCGAIGDAVGAAYEWQSHRSLMVQFPRAESVCQSADLSSEFYYSDDTQSTIATAEAILSADGLSPSSLMRCLADNYQPWRGYGLGFRKIIAAYAEDVPLAELARVQFTDGSYGNGAAMRVAPIALTFHHDLNQLNQEVEQASAVTHCHPLAIEGAQILAHGIAVLLSSETFDHQRFFDALMVQATSSEFIEAMHQARQVQTVDDLIELGSDITAHQSVPTACAAFALHPTDLTACVGDAIRIGGDTDTVASMAGNLFGALNGSAQVPQPMLEAMDRDNAGKGATYLRSLGERLYRQFDTASDA